ncbi:MAG: type II toxin-antitoxin system VapC family toxin [Bacillota bacterium]
MKLFADTGAWIALLVESDVNHTKARSAFSRFLAEHALVVTSNYVIDETVTWLRYQVSHKATVAFRETLTEARAAHGLHVEWMSERIEGEAWDVFLRYSDHELSFTDCTSAVIARELGLVAWAYGSDLATLGFQLVG